ncbi:MAG: NAD(P)H-hydrate dehydratase [Deltaproteobacteria bacterium]|nr:NAD(P)H-hydrate dehydratase [Deltaproteobacteria bacterium]
MKVSTVEEMRNLDRRSMEECGFPQEMLMENAGEAAYFVILKDFGVKNKRFVIFCGIGNNGGDGLVVARKIHSNGGDVKIYLLGDERKFTGAARMNFEIASKIPLNIEHVESLEAVKLDILHSDAVVDAIFGTGLKRNVEGIYKDVIQLINESGKKVFSIDIPSGINGNTGKIMGVAVKSDYTITYGLPKLGNMLYPGYDRCGKLYVSHISFPPSLYDSIKVETNDPIKLPERVKDAHKGDFGEALFIAGASSYFGAPYFSALSFLKAGGGYSRLAAPLSVTPFIANKGSEIVFIPQKETSSGSISLENRDSLLELSEKVDMVILGPGLSLNEETQRLVRELAEEIEKPLIIDGDGITAVSKDVEIIKKRKKETILTPHLGEMSRITKLSVKEIDENKVEVLRKTCGELNAIIVLKGAHSLIGYPDGRVFINMSGNCGMATAGSGDVLTGTIAAMFGLGLNIFDAVRMGVFMHGFSGDLAAMDKGEDGITAQDILHYLPNAMKYYRESFDEVFKENYELQVI